METGDLSQWRQADAGGAFNDASGRVAAVRGPARSGRFSLALSISGADGRSEPRAARIFRWGTRTGAPLPRSGWYGAWFYFPRRYTGLRWWNIFQWKTKVSDDRTDPTLLLNVDNRRSARGPMYVELWNAIEGRTVAASRVNLPVGRWVHLEALYRWSDERTGRVTVFQDGRRVMAVRGVRTAYTSSDRDARQWAVSNYTDRVRPPAATIYVDDAAVRTARTPRATRGRATR
jgi:Polysaccharide lyase